MLSNRERYLQLLETNGISQVYSATLIEAVTERPCSPRTVRSWLNDPSKPSSRDCPSWAVAALEKAIRFMQMAIAKRDAATEKSSAEQA